MSGQPGLLDRFIGGDPARLFLNLELGCTAACSYCYLPHEGFETGLRVQPALRRSAKELMTLLERDERLREGPEGTILSVGCFSECWAPDVKSETIAFLTSLLRLGNRIQFATKRQVEQADLEPLVRHERWTGQVVAYISSATINRWQEYERGTSPPQRRFMSFAACSAVGMRSCLYVKPVLPGITLKDKANFGSVMVRFGVDAVVGDLFTTEGTAVTSPISERLYVVEQLEATELRQYLRAYGRVFENSTQHLLHP